MKLIPRALLPLLLMPCAGCTALSLERHTANQAMTAAEMRYQLVLNTLAKIGTNPGNLPELGIVTDGTASVSDQVNIDLKTAIDGVKGFTSEAISGGISRNPSLQWTIDTAYTPDQIRAVLVACRWVLSGIPPADESDVRLLKLFQVYEDLACLNAQHTGWICSGSRKDVPHDRCLVAQCTGCYFWVPAGRLKALSEFTLILADIATIAPASLVGTATVSIGLKNPKDDKSSPLTQQFIPFRYNDVDPSQIDFLAPVVVYGVPNNRQFKPIWAGVVWCDGSAQMYAAAPAQVGAAPPVSRRDLSTVWPLPPSGRNSAHEYHMQQQQQQFQTHSYLSR